MIACLRRAVNWRVPIILSTKTMKEGAHLIIFVKNETAFIFFAAERK